MKKIWMMLLALTMMLSLAACGASGKENETKEQQNGEVISGSEEKVTEADTTAGSEENTTAAAEEDYQFDVKEDDHTVVITANALIMVFTHDGEKVTGYTAYTDLGTAESAKTRAREIQDAPAIWEQEGIKSVTSKGKYVIIEYTEKAFSVTSYEELHALAEQYKELEK